MRWNFVFAALEADRVDDALALHAFEACFDDRPLGAVDHDRHLANVWLGGHEVEEARHAGLAVEHAFVEIDIDDLRAFLDLGEHDRERAGEVVGLDQLLEARRAGNVGALADIHERRFAHDDVERFEAAQALRGHCRRHGAWCVLAETTLTIAAMCSGVVPQQPPTMLTKLSLAKPPTALPVWAGVSS